MTVVDASLVVAFLTEESRTADAVAFIQDHGLGGLLAPQLLDWEVGNALAMKVKRRLATAEVFSQLLAQFHSMDIQRDNTGRMVDVGVLSRIHDLTIYDAAYLELAKRLGVPLASFDKDLRKAATAEGVALAV